MDVNEMGASLKTLSEMIKEIRGITAEGLVGYYNYCEVIEVIAYNRISSTTVNIISVIVFSEKEGELQTTPQFINNTGRIEIQELKQQWFFGIVKYEIGTKQLFDKLEAYQSTKNWALSTTTLLTGDLVVTPRKFIPIDATETTPLNKVLKNNFWNGSHVFELFDNSKAQLIMLTEKPELLQKLSEEIQKYMPLEIASLSDRLGNIIIQVPVTVLQTNFIPYDDTCTAVEVAWDKRATPRDLQVISTMEFDGIIQGFGAGVMKEGKKQIEMNDASSMILTYLWDPSNKIILAVSGKLASLQRIGLTMNLMGNEPRLIVIPNRDKAKSPYPSVRIQTQSIGTTSMVGEPNKFEYRNWSFKRLYSNERKSLSHKLEFVQFGKNQNDEEIALEKIRKLIQLHGTEGVWIWDPYLSAIDIMNTLFIAHIRAFN